MAPSTYRTENVQRAESIHSGDVTACPMTTLVGAIRDGALDAELAAQLWLLAEGRVPVHVAGSDIGDSLTLATALEPLATETGTVTTGIGSALEDVLRQPVPLRPPSGVVVIVGERRVVACHLHRPPLRDGAGHIRPQGPAVLAVWDPKGGAWEHFAWGVTPELAAATGRRPGDYEIELDRRREFLTALAASGVSDDARLGAALGGYESATTAQ